MSVLTGPYKALQAATAPAAAATWYATTNTIVGVHGCNTLRLYVAGTVASLGDVDFYLTHTHPGDTGATAYSRAAAGDGPEVFGPIPFTGAGQNFFIDIPIGMPLETIQVYYRVGSVASNPQIAIVGCCYLDESGTANAEISVGDIEVDVAALEVLVTATNALLTTIDADTGTIAGDTTSIDGKTPALGTAVMTGSVPVTLATDDTLTAAANALLTTIDADTGNIATDVDVLADSVGTEGTVHDVDFDASVASASSVTAGQCVLCSTEDCYYVWGATPTATTATPSRFLPAGVDRVVTSPGTKIAAIKKAVAGKLQITEMA